MNYGELFKERFMEFINANFNMSEDYVETLNNEPEKAIKAAIYHMLKRAPEETIKSYLLKEHKIIIPNHIFEEIKLGN